MNHSTPSSYPYRRTFIATLLSYVMLTSQLAPMAMAFNGSANRRAFAQTSDIERTKTSEALPQESVASSFAPVPVPLRVTAAGMAPIITASKVDSFPDPDMDGKVSPGQIITYNVTLTNTGPDPALNLTLNDTVDANTTLIPGSAVATPIAFADAYNVIGNVRIQPNAAQGLLANDINPNTGNNTLLTASGGTTSTQGGNVAINANGSFSYDPPVGFTGTDTFTYTATSANGTDVRTVTLTVAGMIFFVNDDDPVAGGDGRLTNPFNCLVGAGCFSDSTADEGLDNIFLFNGAYTGGLSPLNGQKLIGQGATDTLANIAGVGAVQPYSDPLPVTNSNPANVTITTTVPATIAIGVSSGGITLRGFTVGNTTGAKIAGGAFGTLTVGNNTAPDLVLNGTGKALELNGGTIAATSGFSSVTSTSSPTQGIELTSVSGTVSLGSTTISNSTTQGILVSTSFGDINFGNTSVTGGTVGVSLLSNNTGTRTFGTLSVLNSGVGFLHSAGGTTTITGATTITNPGGVGISVDASTTLVSFTNTNVTQSGGMGVSFTNNTNVNGDLTFADLDISPDANQIALSANNNSGTITSTSGTVTSSGASALSITSTPLALVFDGVSSSGGTTPGINLTTATGSLTAGGGSGLTGNNSSAPFTVSGGTVSVTYGGNISQGGPGPTISIVSISGGHSGTINFNTGLLLATGGIGAQFDNADGTYNFNGQLSCNGGDAAVDILNGSGGTFNFAASANISNPSGVAFFVNGGTASVTYNGSITKTNNALATVQIVSHSTGTITFQTNAIGAGNGTGLQFSNADGTYNFSVASGNTILNGGDAGIDILVGSGGTFNFGTGVGIVNPSGTAFNVSTGSPTVTYSGGIDQSTSGQRVVNVDGTTGGSVTFNTGTVTGGASSTGVNINNANGNVSFANLTLGTSVARMTNPAITITGGTGTYGLGAVSIFTNNVSGIVATDADGTLSSTSGTVDASTATAINIDGPAGLTTLSMTLTRVDSAGGTADGISIQDTNGTFTVNGDGSNMAVGGNSSGGVISNKSGADNNSTQGIGVFLNNVTNITLRRMTINGTNQNFAIRGTAVTGFTLEFTTISGTNGNNGAFNEGSVSFDGLTGSAAINSCNISGAWEDNVRVLNASGTLNRLNVSNTTIGLNSLNDGNNGIGLEATGASTILNATISGGTFTGTRGDWINATTQTNSTMDIDVLNNTFSNNHTNSGSAGVRVIVASDGNTTYNIAGNTLRDSKGSAIFANAANTAAILAGRIENNTIGVVAVPNSGSSEASGIALESNGGGDHTSLVNNNTIRQYNNQGINMTIGTTLGNPTNINFTVTTNTLTNPGTVNNDFNAIHLNNGTAPGENFTSCVDIGGAGVLANDVDQGADGATAQLPNTADIRVRQRQSTTVRLPGYGGANNNDVAVQAYLRGRNITRADPDGAAASNTVPTGGGFIGGAACTQPPAAPKPGDEEKSDSEDDKSSPAPVEQITAPANTNSITSRPSISSPRQQPTVKTATAPAHVVAKPRPAPASAPAPVASLKGNGGEPTANPPMIVGNNLTWDVGTLPAGQSVTITFQVTVNTPPPTFTQVSNQGMVTAAGGINVLTDDPDVVGTNNPTVTLVTAPADLFVRDARVAEPAAGSAAMIFTLALSTPAPTGGIVVNVSTANGSATGGTCAGGADYESVTGGTATFAVGEQIKTFPVTVCSDANVEGDETFTLNVNSAPGTVIVDGTGTGTITANVPGTTLISELRTSGPAGLGDDFVEIYNNTNTPHTVPAGGYGLFKMGADCNALPVLIGTIPAATVIPQRGHYLFVGSTYSLTVYAGGNAVLTTDIESDANVGLFSTVDPLQVSTANRLDAVGFGLNTGGVCALLLEGTTLQPASGSTSEYSFVREFTLFSNDVPTPTDGNDNAADFTLVSTTPSTPVGLTAAPRLGAPGPENLAGPNLKKFSQVGSQLIDPMVSASAQPNRFRDTTPDPGNNSLLGTLASRRTFINNTGAPITRLRFRIYDITTQPSPVGTADLRARTSTNATVTVTGVGTVTALATTLETPPAQPNSGGLNSSLAAGTVTLGTPLANGASIHINFLFGVQQSGSFRVFVFVEALP